MNPKPVAGLMAGLLIVAAHAESPPSLAREDRVAPSSIELERKTEPWCPGDCAIGVPFVASYHRGTQRLVFVGAHHAFEPDSPTMRAVDAAFTKFRPEMVILESRAAR
jgi:hypothetical protein